MKNSDPITQPQPAAHSPFLLYIGDSLPDGAKFHSWTLTNGEAEPADFIDIVEGYHPDFYFRDGKYIGPDEAGVEPQFQLGVPAAHSPLPWKMITPSGQSFHALIGTDEEESRWVADVDGLNMPNTANAELIVRAVNAHEAQQRTIAALVEALERSLYWLDAANTEDMNPAAAVAKRSRDIEAAHAEFNDAMVAIRSALALAKGDRNDLR